jgi:hypothetical protein
MLSTSARRRARRNDVESRPSCLEQRKALPRGIVAQLPNACGELPIGRNGAIRRDVFDDGFRDFVRQHEIAQSLKCLQQNNTAEPCRRRERDADTKRQLFICRSVELFQLRLRPAGGSKARIGGVARLHVPKRPQTLSGSSGGNPA